MAAMLLGSVFLAATLLAPSVAAETNELKGTWSGNWMPKGGVPEAITVELKQDNNGKLTGKFLTPVPMDFSKATFNPKTGIVMLEALDPKSGKHYTLEAKVKGTELNGTLGADDVKGDVRLIKWTFFPR